MATVTRQRLNRINRSARRWTALDAKLQKMWNLAASSVRAGFPSCTMAFSREATRLEGERSREMDRMVRLCTDGSLEATEVVREAFEEMRAEAPTGP